jgi:uncharacterized membrane protein YfcA
MLPLPSLLLLIVLIFLTSFFLSMIGLGGGVLYIPILTLIFQLPIQVSVGISLFCMTFSTLSATIGFWTKKCVNWQLAVAYDLFDIPGIILGAWLTIVLPAFVLELFCGLAVCLIGIMTLRKKSDNSCPIDASTIDKNSVPSMSDEELAKACKFAWSGKNFKWVIVSSFFGGLVAGMVGLGGGTVDTTTMVLLGVPMHMAAGSSTLAMFFTNAFGVTTHILLGNILWDYAIPMGIVATIAGYLGSRFASRVNANILQKSVGLVAIFTGVRLIL